MNLVVEQLQQDHRQLVRVLYHLEKAIKSFSGIGRGTASMESVLDILDYIQVYPEIWHHPVEDLIYEILLQKEIPEPQLLANCIEEHGVLELLTENLHSYIDQLAAGREEVRLRFVRAGSDYVNRQLTHMEHEQTTLFPLIDRYLNDEDWELIKQRIKSIQPAADQGRYKRYQSLYQDIASASVVTAH